MRTAAVSPGRHRVRGAFPSLSSTGILERRGMTKPTLPTQILPGIAAAIERGPTSSLVTEERHEPGACSTP